MEGTTALQGSERYNAFRAPERELGGAWWNNSLLLLVLSGILSLALYAAGKGYVSISEPEASIRIKTGFIATATEKERPFKDTYGTAFMFDSEILVRKDRVDNPSGNEKKIWVSSIIDLVTAPDRIWSIYLPQSKAGFRFYVNGFELADVSKTIANASDRVPTSLVSIPNGVLLAGSNEIQLVYTNSSDEEPIFVSSYLIGPLSEIAPYYLSHKFLSESFPKVMIVILSVLGLVLLLVGIFTLSDRRYIAFSVCSLFWAAYLVTRLSDTGFYANVDTMRFSSAIILYGFTLSLVYLCVAFTRRKVGKYLHISMGALSITTFVILLSTNANSLGMDSFLTIVVLLMIAIGILLLLCQRNKLPIGTYVLLSILFIFCFQILDQSVTVHSSVSPSYTPLQFLAPLFVFFAVANIVQDFVRSTQRLERINNNLEQLVSDRARKIETEILARKNVEQQKLIADERNRIMMEMHDGLGARLVGAIARIDVGKDDTTIKDLRVELKEALSELRLVVDSMNPIEGDLNAVLAIFRARLQKNLKGVGKNLIWKVEDLPQISNLNPEKTLNILRILQEATTNAIKYSSGSTITVKAITGESDRTILSVTDNGAGMDRQSQISGFGLDNMKKRAAKVGATLNVISSDKGVTVCLEFEAQGCLKDNEINAKIEGKAISVRAERKVFRSQKGVSQRLPYVVKTFLTGKLNGAAAIRCATSL